MIPGLAGLGKAEPSGFDVQMFSTPHACRSIISFTESDLPVWINQNNLMNRAPLRNRGPPVLSAFPATCGARTTRSQVRYLNIMPSAKEQSPAIKVLMLHGYTQNGNLFHAKTRAMEKHLQKAIPGISLYYPTGPLQLKPSDVPGFDPTTSSDPDSLEAFGWWRRSNTSEPPEYVGLEDGLETIARLLESEGPFDGVIGFSQGACFAAMIASLLEGQSRKQAFEKARSRSSLAIPYPASFARLSHPPLRFCTAYCGFRAPGDRYLGFYEDPKIQTPACHFIGSLDSVVEESRTQALVDATGGADKTQVVMHPGGHFVPSGKQYLDIIAAFIKQKKSSDGKMDQQEERVEDMEVPF